MFGRNTVLLLIATMLAACGAAQSADQTFRLARGQQATVELQENPSTGYRWQVDVSSSTNLSILRLEDRGFASGAGDSRKPLLGAPGVHRWSIAALSAGSARVTFVYRRPWESAPVRRHAVAIEATGP
jgi:inhibitor of cysteine peptidase